MKSPKVYKSQLSQAISFMVLMLVLIVSRAQAQTTTFTYQGRFTDSGTAANGTYDMQFKLFDSATVGAGTQIGSTITNTTVTITEGVFTVQLDFGAAGFPGADRFVEIGVRSAGSSASYTVLSPRQQLTSSVYAIKANSAAMADNATQLGGVAASQYALTNDSRLTDSRTPTAGSSNYIQNSTTPQQASFNINGNGTVGGQLQVNRINSASNYSIAGQNVLGAHTTNVYAGFDAGASLSTGGGNAFFGSSAGTSNTVGNENSFFGASSGSSNTNGNSNAFFGSSSGALNTTGGSNSFFGARAGFKNSTGVGNAFFGTDSGKANTTGVGNTFFGALSGAGNTTACCNAFFGNLSGAVSTGVANSFFGNQTGERNTVGSGNSFFGAGSGNANTTANDNSFFGANSGVANTTGFANSFFGSAAGVKNINGLGNSFFGSGAGGSNTAECCNAFFGNLSGANSTGVGNSFFGNQSGQSNIAGNNNAFFGNNVGATNTNGSAITLVGSFANVGATTLTNATAIGTRAMVSLSNSLVLGSIGGVNGAAADTNVGIGTTFPKTRFHVADNSANFLAGNAGCSNPSYFGLGFGSSLNCTNYSLLGNGVDTIINRPSGGSIQFRENSTIQMSIAPGGVVTIGTLAPAGLDQLCRNGSSQISFCSSSLRYKKDVQPFTRGLTLLNQFKPITFKWKSNDSSDLGFGAEDVAAVEPLLVTHNDKGQVEGVKYDRITAVLVNAVKEQQEQIKQQQAVIAGLKILVCRSHPHAAVCK